LSLANSIFFVGTINKMGKLNLGHWN
jgi:hypothetical protein